MAEEPTSQQLIESYGDEEALAAIQALGRSVLPELRRAYAGLKRDDYIIARWLNRIVVGVAPDPAGEALALLSRVESRCSYELAWLLRRGAGAAHRDRIGQRLARLCPLDRASRTISLPSFADVPRVAVLCEALGLTGEPDDLPLLAGIFEACQAEIAKAGDRESSILLRVEYGPAAATAAGALLAISEHAGLRNERDRAAWRRASVEAALAGGLHDEYLLAGLNAPMPLLFAHAPVESGRLLAGVAARAKEADRVLSDLRAWLFAGQEQGVGSMVEVAAGDAFDWLDTLENRATAGSYGPSCALDIRAILQPEAALGRAMDDLRRVPLNPAAVGHAAAVIERTAPFWAVAAIAVENFFLHASASQKGLAAVEENRGPLDKRLSGLGLAPTAGWAWRAPEGQSGPVITAAGLHGWLCTISRACERTARTATENDAWAAMAALADLPAHPLLVHALYRNLLLALGEAGPSAAAALWAGLDCTRLEQDPTLAGALLTMAAGILDEAAGRVSLLLLDSPAIRSDAGLAERVARAAGQAPAPGAGDRLMAFAREVGWGVKWSDYGLNAALTEAMGRLDVQEAVPALVGMLGQSALGSNIEVALLQIVARHPGVVDDATFTRALELALADGYADHGPSIWGERANAWAVEALGSAPLDAPVIAHLARALAGLARQCEPVPEALGLLLARLPDAIALARTNPGEAWQDRNWAGYSATPQEQIAEAMSAAVEALCRARYSPGGWRRLLDGLLGVDLDLRRVTLAHPGPLDFGYPVQDLYTVLMRGLEALDDAGIDEALSRRTPREALAAARDRLVVLGDGL